MLFKELRRELDRLLRPGRQLHRNGASEAAESGEPFGGLVHLGRAFASHRRSQRAKSVPWPR